MAFISRLLAFIVLLGICPATGFAQGTKYEAEGGTLTGAVSVQNTLTINGNSAEASFPASATFTHKIHSGAMSLRAKEEADWLFSQTGKYPALIGLDFMNNTRNYSWYDKSEVVTGAGNCYNRNGLVVICWHWRDPSRATDEFYTSGPSFDISKITGTTSAEYQAMLSDAPDYSEYPQGFFIAGWKPRTAVVPDYTDVPAPVDPVTVAITVDCSDTVTLVSPYLFGDNANLWTGPMSDNATLMKNIKNRDQGIMRGPGGSTSDAFFWNRSSKQRPPDVPGTLLNDPSNTNWPWYGQRAENWTMHVDSFYSILSKGGLTGMLTVNYGYARYGTSANPVAQAAHMAADWVRYDKGRTKFWEIGNEVYGSWEAGYRIDRSLNKDGQPEYITPKLYGQHCRVFIDSMRAAASETGFDIRIGVVMVEAASTHSSWNTGVATQVGDIADFYIVHSYYTPWNTNSDVATVLNSYRNTEGYINYVRNTVAAAGMPELPVALTEYNIFAVGSNQPVSHVNGMQAVLATGDMIRTGYGAACRWDLANGWDNGNDHGMYSYNEPVDPGDPLSPKIPNYTPHPAFYHLYYMRRHTGDVLLKSTITGASGVVITPTAFSSGHIGASLVNTTKSRRVVRLNLEDYGVGDRYYTYTLTGTEGQDFSRKVFINGIGGALEAGGPESYETIRADAVVTGDEIKINLPPLSVICLLVEPGSRQLAINNEVTAVDLVRSDDAVTIWPNPSGGNFTVTGMPDHVSRIEICNLGGDLLLSEETARGKHEVTLSTGLVPGIYLVTLHGDNYTATRKLVIK